MGYLIEFVNVSIFTARLNLGYKRRGSGDIGSFGKALVGLDAL